MSKKNKVRAATSVGRRSPETIDQAGTETEVKPYHDEELMDASQQEIGQQAADPFEDEQDDERHRLIASDGASARAGVWQAGSPSDPSCPEHKAKNKLDNLFTFVSAGFASQVGPKSRASAHERKQTQTNRDQDHEQAADSSIQRRSPKSHRAHQHNDYMKLAVGNMAERSKQGSHWAAGLSRRLINLLLMALVVGICLLLYKLASLVQDERHRLLGAGHLPPGRQSDLASRLESGLDRTHTADLEAEKQQRWLVSSPKCHIPVLEPWDESIRGLVSRNAPMNCSALLGEILTRNTSEWSVSKGMWPNHLAKSLTRVQSNLLYFSDEAVAKGALGSGDLPGECCVARVTRKEANDEEVESGPCVPVFEQGAFLNSSVVEVRCARWNYTNVHSFVVQDNDEVMGLARVAKSKLNPDGDFYSVLMLGVDTISRLNGQRQLNKTLKVLADLYQTLEFDGYNKVGENTFPNLIPLLTGLKPEQLSEVQCWHNTAEGESADDYLDNCKFLWNFYQQAGYLTYLGEDWPQASTFNYLKPGFRYPPTAFYERPFVLARDKLVFPKFNSPGCAACQLNRPLVEVDIENLLGFIETNPLGLPYFAFHWINCPQHDDLNGASKFDDILAEFFRRFKGTAQANKTFVMFFSDHGYRWENFVSTRLGHYESSLPMMTIAPPPEFIKRHPDLYQRLKSHRSALLTPFDIFRTLIDLKNLGTARSPSAAKRTRRQALAAGSPRQVPGEHAVMINENWTTTEADTAFSSATVRQVQLIDGVSFKQKFDTLSLFDSHTEQQLDRGCGGAGIPDNYCVCHQFEPVPQSRADVLGAAYYLVYVHLEARLRDHLDICEPLELERVHHAEMFDLGEARHTKDKTSSNRRKRSLAVDQSQHQQLKTTPEPVKHLHGAGDEQNKHDYLPNREYSLMFSTLPGGGIFQEVVRFYGDNITLCELEIAKTRKVVEDPWAKLVDKHESVLTMNDVCDFSVHSDSLSRFNLYKDQSRCVKSGIELKKICYCKDLLKFTT